VRLARTERAVQVGGLAGPASDGVADSSLATVNLSVVNSAPTVQTQPTLYAVHDRVFTGSLAVTDYDSDALQYTVVSGPQHGTTSSTVPGWVTIVPALASLRSAVQCRLSLVEPKM